VLVRDLELPALLLDFVEEAHVLDRDHGLVGEGLQEAHEFLRHRARLRPDHGSTPMGSPSRSIGRRRRAAPATRRAMARV
jgi:hypothetical protein